MASLRHTLLLALGLFAGCGGEISSRDDATLRAVAPGKVADLLLLDANPLEDVRHTERIRAVVLGGRYFDRAALDALLAEARAGDRER